MTYTLEVNEVNESGASFWMMINPHLGFPGSSVNVYHDSTRHGLVGEEKSMNSAQISKQEIFPKRNSFLHVPEIQKKKRSHQKKKNWFLFKGTNFEKPKQKTGNFLGTLAPALLQISSRSSLRFPDEKMDGEISGGTRCHVSFWGPFCLGLKIQGCFSFFK